MSTKKSGFLDVISIEPGKVEPTVREVESVHKKKHKFIMGSKQPGTSPCISFVDQEYTSKTHYDPQSDNNFYLQSDKNLRAVMSFSHCSPELYLQTKDSEVLRV